MNLSFHQIAFLAKVALANRMQAQRCPPGPQRRVYQKDARDHERCVRRIADEIIAELAAKQ